MGGRPCSQAGQPVQADYGERHGRLNGLRQALRRLPRQLERAAVAVEEQVLPAGAPVDDLHSRRSGRQLVLREQVRSQVDRDARLGRRAVRRRHLESCAVYQELRPDEGDLNAAAGTVGKRFGARLLKEKRRWLFFRLEWSAASLLWPWSARR